MTDEEATEIDTLNAEIADLKSTLESIQKTETTVDSGMDAIATYVGCKDESDGFLVQDAEVENPFHVAVKGQNASGWGGGDEGACCTIL